MRGIEYKMKSDYGDEEKQSSGTSLIYLAIIDRANVPLCTADADK